MVSLRVYVSGQARCALERSDMAALITGRQTALVLPSLLGVPHLCRWHARYKALPLLLRQAHTYT